MNNDKNTKASLIKIVAIGIMAIVIIAILLSANDANNTNYMGSGMMEKMHGGDQSLGNNAFPDFLRWIVTIAAQLFGVLFFIGVIIAVFLLIKKYIEPIKSVEQVNKKVEKNYTNCPQCQSKILDEFKFCPVCSTKLIVECVNCHKPMQSSWQCCPYCGKSQDDLKNITRRDK